MNRLLLALVLAFAVSAVPASAQLRFEGEIVQGGLVIGHAAPGSRVTVDGKAVRVTKDGRFLVGFGRDAEGLIVVSALEPGGKRWRQAVAVRNRSYQISRIDGLPDQQVSPGPAALARIRDDNAMIAAVRRVDEARAFFGAGFAWPVKGRISGVFGSQRILNGKPRRPHYGVDIAAPAGTPVRAMSDGVVALVHPDMYYTGITVMIDHGHGLTSVYAHMSGVRVKQGETVAKGATIGAVGQTGRATGPHLHWGVTLFSTYLDPALIAGPAP